MDSFVFIISTGDRDRHGTRLNIDGWELENYRRNPIVVWSEAPLLNPEPDPDTVIGTSKVWIEDRKLYAEWFPDPTSPVADKLVKKLKNGRRLAASVQFIPRAQPRYGTGDEAKGRKNETVYYERQELIGWKICNLGSNPKCLSVPNYSRDHGARRAIMRKKLELAKAFVRILE